MADPVLPLNTLQTEVCDITLQVDFLPKMPFLGTILFRKFSDSIKNMQGRIMGLTQFEALQDLLNPRVICTLDEDAHQIFTSALPDHTIFCIQLKVFHFLKKYIFPTTFLCFVLGLFYVERRESWFGQNLKKKKKDVMQFVRSQSLCWTTLSYNHQIFPFNLYTWYSWDHLCYSKGHLPATATLSWHQKVIRCKIKICSVCHEIFC